MKILIAGFNDNLFIRFCSLLEKMCHIDFKKLWKYNIAQLYLFGYLYSKNLKLDTILLYCGLKQHITAEFSAVKRNASVSDGSCFILLSSASG